jgi:type II secretory pathway pseudopilin PulG
MLVVLALVGTLMAIVLPAYQKVNESAKVTKDLSNLRQIGSAVLLFANDYGFIPGKQWPSTLEPTYLSDLSVCQSPFDRRSSLRNGSSPISYDINSNVWGVDPLSIVSPSDCILMAPLTADTPTLKFASTSIEPGLQVPLCPESNGSGDSGGTCAGGKRIPVLCGDLHANVVAMGIFHSAQPNPDSSAEITDLRWNR